MLSALTNTELLEKIDYLVASERKTTVEILHHLLEVERRGLFRELGYSSMFDYATRRLRYSDSGAGRRIAAARALRNHPELGELLRSGNVNLCTVSAAASEIKKRGGEEVIASIQGKSKREVEVVLAKRSPKPRRRERARPVATLPVPILPLFATPTGGSEVEVRHEINFSGDKEFMKKVNEAKSLLSGKYPRGVTFEALFGEALDALLYKRSPKQRAERRKVREAARARKRSRHVPAKVRDAVHLRDGGRCTFVAPDGTRCECTHDLELHHRVPYACGGRHEPSNLELLCRAHNALFAERDFGMDKIRRYQGET